MATGGTVYGAVYNSATMEMISNASVTCPNMSINTSSGSYYGVTEDNGQYTLTASAPGFSPKNWNATINNGGVFPHNFGLDAD